MSIFGKINIDISNKMELSRNQRINLRCFIMLDFEISKKLNIKAEKIDLDKSYYSFNPNTCYLTIELYLKKMLI